MLRERSLTARRFSKWLCAIHPEAKERGIMNVGFIGLGKMGSAMARNLIRAGHEVTVFNRTPERAKELQSAGARVAQTPAEVCKGEAVITCLADDEAVTQVVSGETGIAEGLTDGAIHLSMSTLSVHQVEQLKAIHRKRRQRFIAAPVFGRPDAAAAAKLLIVAGGEANAINECQPLFEAMGQRIIKVGEDPTAAAMVKLTGNFLLASAVESLSEAIALLKKSGTDPKVCLEALTTTLFASPVYQNYSAMMLQEKYEPGFRLALGLKDVRLALAAAESFGAQMPTAELLAQRLQHAVALGFADKDLAALALVSEETAKSEAAI
ncbi:MAG: NAD(P)-dependent oxidoreductase [Acidobacteriota bacterium]